MISGVLGASLVAILFNLWGANSLMSFDWYNHLLVGGFAFGIVFMATDPVSGERHLRHNMSADGFYKGRLVKDLKKKSKE